MGDVSLTVGGNAYLGWEELTITRSLEALCASFELTYIDAWEYQKSDDNYSRWYLKPGDEVEVYIDKDLVITGYIDQVDASFDDKSRDFSVHGRDVTADLVDCAASLENAKNYSNLNLYQLATILAKPYGITVILDADPGKRFSRVSVEHGQSVHNVLDILCKQRGVLLTTNKDGDLVITEPASLTADIAIVEGQNLKSGNFSLDHKQRFSKYVVYGQSATQGNWGNSLARKTKSTATDDAVTRYRPKVSVAERDASQNETIKQAQWEAAYAAARGTKFNAVVNGWRQGDKTSASLWLPNSIVEVQAPSLGLSGEMLIETVSYKLSNGENGGEITEMTITKPDAWVPAPVQKSEENQFLKIGALAPLRP